MVVGTDVLPRCKCRTSALRYYQCCYLRRYSRLARRYVGTVDSSHPHPQLTNLSSSDPRAQEQLFPRSNHLHCRLQGRPPSTPASNLGSCSSFPTHLVSPTPSPYATTCSPSPIIYFLLHQTPFHLIPKYSFPSNINAHPESCPLPFC